MSMSTSNETDLFAGVIEALALLLDMIAEILEQDDRAGRRVLAGLLDNRAHAVVQECHLPEKHTPTMVTGQQSVLHRSSDPRTHQESPMATLESYKFL